MVRCPEPNCAIRPGRGDCVPPNAWNLFRVKHKGMYKRTRMSREYARFKQVPANMTNKALCAISKRYIRDNRRVLWVPTDRVVAGDRSAYPNDSPCGRLTREAVHPEELCGGWEEVYRLVRLIPKIPKTNETITNMTKSLYLGARPFRRVDDLVTMHHGIPVWGQVYQSDRRSAWADLVGNE
jgi:hypothetical protein